MSRTRTLLLVTQTHLNFSNQHAYLRNTYVWLQALRGDLSDAVSFKSHPESLETTQN